MYALCIAKTMVRKSKIAKIEEKLIFVKKTRKFEVFKRSDKNFQTVKFGTDFFK